MTCDELELLLPEGVDGPDPQAHLAECAQCRQTSSLLSAVAQPPPSPTEKAKLVGLASAVQTKWVRQQQRRSRLQSVVGLAIAACLGAVLAAGVMWNRPGAPPPEQPSVQTHPEPEVLVWMEDASGASSADDESSFEVAWPSLNDEGDVL